MKNPHFEERQSESDIAKSLADAYRAVHEEGYGASAQQAGFQKIKDKESGGPGAGKGRSDDEIKKEKGGPAFLDRLAKAKAKMNKEELELDENRRAARAAGGYKDDSKKQNDPSKAGFTGVGNMSIDQIRKMSARMDKEKTQKEGLDPVGKEDGDVNNDGKKDKTDKYLMNRRKAIGNAIKGKMKKEEVEAVAEGDGDPCWDSHKQVGMKKKGGKMVPNCVPKTRTESFSSNWRQDLSEIMTDDIDSKPIKEKNVKNKVKINPKLGEAIEQLGGTLLEEIEVDEIDVIIESVYSELIEEGYSEDDVESAIEKALNEAEVTMGHDSYGPQKGAPERTRDKLKKKAKGFLGKVAVKAYNKARDAKAAASPMVQRIKTSAKRGVRKAALKVADKLKEENVGEAVYGGEPEKKKDTRMVVTNADKKANTPAYQKMKAGDKRYKSADHMDEEKKPLPKNKMFRKAGNLGRDVVSPSVTDDQRQKAYDRSKKIVKTLNKANEEVRKYQKIFITR